LFDAEYLRNDTRYRVTTKYASLKVSFRMTLSDSERNIH